MISFSRSMWQFCIDSSFCYSLLCFAFGLPRLSFHNKYGGCFANKVNDSEKKIAISSLKPDFQVHVTESHTKRTEIIRSERMLKFRKVRLLHQCFHLHLNISKMKWQENCLEFILILLTLQKHWKQKTKTPKRAIKTENWIFCSLPASTTSKGQCCMCAIHNTRTHTTHGYS